eukprot:3133-Chlamydomonas_euryale.AAC.4
MITTRILLQRSPETNTRSAAARQGPGCEGTVGARAMRGCTTAAPSPKLNPRSIISRITILKISKSEKQVASCQDARAPTRLRRCVPQVWACMPQNGQGDGAGPHNLQPTTCQRCSDLVIPFAFCVLQATSRRAQEVRRRR